MNKISLVMLVLPAVFVTSDAHAEFFSKIASFPVAANLPAEHIERADCSMAARWW